MNPQITAAFLAVMDVNVIVVDWGHWANGAYNRAVNAVPSVGNHLGDLISFLFSTVGGNWNQVHLVGFSLGAHVVGNAGRRVGGRASRVTGKVLLFYRKYIVITAKRSKKIFKF